MGLARLRRLEGMEEFSKTFQSKIQKQLRPHTSGRNIQRWRGQSLEFRDYAPYVRGDDIRYVDWRASARSGKENELLVRRFQAEEEFNIILSIDTRQSMFMPEAFSKLQAAAWAVEAAAQIALRSGDRVYLHRLFGPVRPPVMLNRQTAIPNIFPILQEFAQTPIEESKNPAELPELNLSTLQGRHLINSALVIFSDFYFLQDLELIKRMNEFIKSTKKGWRGVVLVNLDSWPFERFQIESGRGDVSRQISGPRLNGHYEFDAEDDVLKIVENNIHTVQKEFLKRIGRSAERFDLHWHWPAKLASPGARKSDVKKKVTAPDKDAIGAEDFFKNSFAVMSSSVGSEPNPFCQLFIHQR